MTSWICEGKLTRGISTGLGLFCLHGSSSGCYLHCCPPIFALLLPMSKHFPLWEMLLYSIVDCSRSGNLFVLPTLASFPTFSLSASFTHSLPGVLLKLDKGTNNGIKFKYVLLKLDKGTNNGIKFKYVSKGRYPLEEFFNDRHKNRLNISA